jgi:hypothetical protein
MTTKRRAPRCVIDMLRDLHSKTAFGHSTFGDDRVTADDFIKARTRLFRDVPDPGDCLVRRPGSPENMGAGAGCDARRLSTGRSIRA